MSVVEKRKYSVLKAAEGGVSRKYAVSALKEAGIEKVRPCYSPYVGHYGLEVEGTEEEHAKAEDILF